MNDYIYLHVIHDSRLKYDIDSIENGCHFIYRKWVSFYLSVYRISVFVISDKLVASSWLRATVGASC